MRKKVVLILSIFLGLSLIGCKKNTLVLPTTSHEKVQFAFNGVENSLKNPSARSYLSTKRQVAAPTEQVISTIFAALKDEGESDNAGIEYNDTPLIQFQYLKSLYNEIGNNYSFNTKYYHELTGDIYYDFATDEDKDGGDQYLQHYDFIFSFLINIDSNDLITANVGFDITFTHENEVRREYMYAELILDYDMTSGDPTYKFTMRDITDLLEYPNEEERDVTAEYDYIDVEKGHIKEFRKFCIQSKTGFSNYQDSDFVYKFAALRGYRNSHLYKIEDPFNKAVNLKHAVIVGLGLDNLLNTYKSFLTAPGVDNPVIETVIQRFNNIFGKDFVYHIAESAADEEWESHDDPVHHNRFLMLKLGDSLIDPNIQIYEDVSLSGLFTGQGGKASDRYTICLLQDEYEFIEEYDSLDKFNIRAKSRAYDGTEWVEVTSYETKFSELILESGYNYREAFTNIEVELTLKEDEELSIDLVVEIYNEDLPKLMAKNWPKKYLDTKILIKDVLPVFTGNNVYFQAQFDGQDGSQGYIRLYDVTAQEVETYCSKLVNELEYVKEERPFSAEVKYTKRVSDEYMLELQCYNGNGKEGSEPGSLIFHFIEKAVPEKTIREYILSLFDNKNIDLPEYTKTNEYTVNEFYEDKNIMEIYGATQEDIEDYLRSLTDYGFVVTERSYMLNAIKYVDGTFYKLVAEGGNHLYIHVTHASFSFVGSMNGWDVTNADYDFVDFHDSSDITPYSFTMDMDFNAGDTFKVVLNHSYEFMEYNFNDIDFEGNGDKPKEGQRENIICEEGNKYLNIKIVNATHYKVTITFIMNDQGYLAESINKLQISFD